MRSSHLGGRTDGPEAFVDLDETEGGTQQNSLMPAMLLTARMALRHTQQIVWEFLGKLLSVREQIEEVKPFVLSLARHARETAIMAAIIKDCRDALRSTARTQRGQLRLVQDILQTKCREAAAEARVALGNQLHYLGMAHHLAQLYKRQAELKQQQREAGRLRMTWVGLTRTLEHHNGFLQGCVGSDLSVHAPHFFQPD